MKTMTTLKSATMLAALLALGACSDMPTNNSGASYPQSNYPTSTNQGYGTNQGYNTNQSYGVVQNIELVRVENQGGGSDLGVGTIAGAVVGGIIGNQVGSGGARPAATVLGAAGGAYAGHQLEKRNQQTSDAYKITIRMQNGSYQTVTQTSTADIRVGDRVQIANGVAQRY